MLDVITKPDHDFYKKNHHFFRRINGFTKEVDLTENFLFQIFREINTLVTSLAQCGKVH